MKARLYPFYLLLFFALLSACTPAAPTNPSTQPAEPNPPAADGDAFPITLEHEFGSTVIEDTPQRVISLGYGDEDDILALGIQPIAVRHWFGAPEYGVWPWGQAALGDATPQVLEMGFGALNFESIAALQPDLIIAIRAGLSEDEYATLSQLAPVVVRPPGYDTQMPWQESLRLVGQATGRSAQAETVIAEVEAQIAAVSAGHPEFAGKSVTIAEYLEPGSYYIFDADNVRYRVLNALGFVMPEPLLAAQADASFNGTISEERLDLLEADLLIWGVADTAQQQELEAAPLYQTLQVVADNHDLFFTYNEEPNLISAAHAYGTALSIPYLLEEMVPHLSAVLGGEAAMALVCEIGFRPFDHELLATEPTCIPENPARIAYLIYPSYLYALGVKPMAAWGLERDAENYPFIAEWLNDGIVDHGMPPNLEMLVGLDPDLLLYDIRRVADIVEPLQQIAPLVTFDVNSSFAWQDRHRFNAAVFQRETLAEAQIALYDQRVAELRTAIEASRGDISNVTISLVRLGNEGVIDLLGPWYTSASVIQEIGFALPEAVDLSIDEMQARHGNIYTAEISQELIPTVDGDVLIVFGPGGGGESASDVEERVLGEIRQSPIWGTLDAVQADAIYFKGDYWLQPSILTAHLVIDELAEIFKVELATPNPFLSE